MTTGLTKGPACDTLIKNNEQELNMKIGLFCDSFFPMIDGVVYVIDNYARILSREHDVTVFAACPKEEADKHPYRVVPCSSINLGIEEYNVPLPELDAEFTRILEKSDLDIVHIHSPFIVGRTGIRYAHRHDIPVVATIHSQFRQNFEKLYRSKQIVNGLTNYVVRCFDRCDACYAVSAEMGRVFHEEYGLKQIPGVLGNATDMMPVADRAASAAHVNKLYGLKPDEPVLLFSGRLNLLKGIDFIADALAVLRDRGVSFRMMYAGCGPDEQVLRDKIADLDLNDRCILTGRIEDRALLADLYARAYLFLFPSFYDSSSLVQIEAASQNTPTLFCDGSVTSKSIRPDVDGFSAAFEPQAYADKIQQILTDRELHDRVAAKAHSDLWITWERRVSEAAALYEKHIAMKKEELSRSRS